MKHLWPPVGNSKSRQMIISDHKTGSMFERNSIVDPNELQKAAEKPEKYLESKLS